MSKKKYSIPFIRYSLPFILLSVLLIAFSVYTWIKSRDSKYGIDFSGGTEVVVRFEKSVQTAELRGALEKLGFASAVVQSFEGDLSDYSIRLNGVADESLVQNLKDSFSKIDPAYKILKQDYVGPIIGEQIRNNGVRAVIFSFIAILIYVSFRFEWPYAIGSVAALVHDVVITSGIFIFSGRELSAGVLASLLTIIGYSINDTIVIFDRVRENFASAKGKTKGNISSIVNLSINETLSRTFLTSLTVFFVVMVLWLMGGGAIEDLAFSLVIGVIVGTYSTIFIASPILVGLQKLQVRNSKN